MRRVSLFVVALAGVVIPPALAISDCTTGVYKHIRLALTSADPGEVIAEHATLETMAEIRIYENRVTLRVATSVASLLLGDLQ